MRKLLLIKKELALIVAILTVGIYIVSYGQADLITGSVNCENTIWTSQIRCEEFK